MSSKGRFVVEVVVVVVEDEEVGVVLEFRGGR
jgi:hypothetical protein